MKRRKPIRKVSKRMAALLAEYDKLKKQFLRENPICQVSCCIEKAVDAHHRRGRGRFLLDVSTFMAVCRPCHRRIHHEVKWATEMGYLQSRLSKTI